MDTTAEMDQAGRVVVPKKLRDALQLLPGTRLSLRIDGETIVMKADNPGIQAYQKQGLWVYHAPDTISTEDVRDVIEGGRGERESRTLERVAAE